MAAVRSPVCSSWRATRSAPRLVRQNTMVGPAELMILAHSGTRWSRATFQNRWVTLAPSAGSLASSWRAGLRW